MSRSQPNKHDNEIPQLGLGFDVGESVCDCFLKKIDIQEKHNADYDFHRIYLSFLKKNKWITKFISVMPKESFKSDSEYADHKYYVQTCLENLMACYISGEHMKRILTESNTFSIVGYFEEIRKALTDKQFWSKSVCIKTVPGENGSVHVAKYPPFMSNPLDKRWFLKYTDYEIKIIAKQKLNKK